MIKTKHSTNKKSVMNLPITTKISLVLLIPALASLLGLALFYLMMLETDHDGVFINVAGRQRLLAQQLNSHADMVKIGHDEHRSELHKTINTFDKSLLVLEHGGQIMGRELSEAPTEVMGALLAVKRLWLVSKPALIMVASQPHNSSETRLAYETLKTSMPQLKDYSGQLVTSYEIWSDGLRQDMLVVLAVVAAIGASSFIMGGWVVRRYVMERIKTQQKLMADKEEQAALIQQLHDAQDQLLQSEKMASIGQLAAGVAHEINNPVGYINSNIGSLKKYIDDFIRMLEVYEQTEKKLTDPAALSAIKHVKQEIELGYLKDDIKDLIKEAGEGVVRVKQIVQDLKDFSHVDEVEWQWADVHKGIDSTLNVVNNEIKYKANVVKEYGDLPKIECLVSQLNQVFMNLLVNAAQAMDDKHLGTITVRTGTGQDGIWVEIKDTGKGMDEETQKRIFEPFYTTKPVGKGTGLGLSLSYNIIKKHHGDISVESGVGKGSKFHIWLPVQQEIQQAAS